MENSEEQELLKSLEAQLLADNKKLEECLKRYTRDTSEDDTEDESGENENPTEKSSGEKLESEKVDEVETDDERTKSPNKFSLVIETADEIEDSNILPLSHGDQPSESFIEINTQSVTKLEIPSPIEETTAIEHEVYEPINTASISDEVMKQDSTDPRALDFNVEDVDEIDDHGICSVYQEKQLASVFDEDEYTGTRIDDQLEFLAEGDPDDNIPVSYPNTLVFNETYQNHLYGMLGTLQEALQENRKRQEEIEIELVELEQGRTLDYHRRHYEQDASVTGSSNLLPSNPLASNTRKATVSIFAAPYFKDWNLFSHPDNPDTKRKKDANELDVYLSTPKEWKKSEKKKLYNAVKENALGKRLRSLHQERELVRTRRNNRYTDEKEKEELTKRLKDIRNVEAKIRLKPDTELFENISEEFSWLEISMQTFEGYFSEQSCRLMWRHVLHPSINIGHWAKKEDQLLKQMAENRMSQSQGFVNWDNVASEIGSGRIAFHCFMRFQQKHNTFLDRRKWTYEEDQRLKQLVGQCRINKHFVPWPKVAYYMTNRTKDQCYQRYVYSLQSHLRKGIFTENEDFVIIIGVKLFGHNWAKISEFLPNRTPIQIHSRFNTFLNANFQAWGQQEDINLLQLVKEKGYRDWAEKAKHFENRTRSQCRNRFHVIYKMFQLQPNTFNLSKMKYRSREEITLQGRRQKSLYDNLEKKVNLFLGQRKADHANKKIQTKRQKDNISRTKASRRKKGRSNEKRKFDEKYNSSEKNTKTDSAIDVKEDVESLNWQISDDDGDSDLVSEGEDFMLDLESENIDATNQSSECTSGSITTANSKSYSGSNVDSSSTLQDTSTLYHITPEGIKIPNRYLLEFMRSLQSELPIRSDSWESGGYENMAYQRIPIERRTGSVLTKKYRNPMPIKHMSTFVSTNKKGVPITTYKGNIGRPGAVHNTVCKQALTDRSLSIYFRPSWPGRVGKPVGSYKMFKSQQDQLRQALAAANFYGQLLQVYPDDLKHRVNMTPMSLSNNESDERSDRILQLYVSQQNDDLFCHNASQQPITSSSMQAERTISKTYSQQSSVRSCTTKPILTSSSQLLEQHTAGQTPIRTYSRKRKNIPGSNSNADRQKIPLLDSSKGASTHKVYKVEKRNVYNHPLKEEFIRFVPSNNQTLVGLRGLLLQLRTFKTLVHPDGTGVRISLDRIVQEGVHHIDLFSDQKEANISSIEDKIVHKYSATEIQESLSNVRKVWSGGGQMDIWGQKKLTPEEADELLVDRFLSLYFWPAQMSSVRPPPRENIFEPSKPPNDASDYAGLVGGFPGTYSSHPTGHGYSGRYAVLAEGRESVAAAEPFDASKLIEAAKSRAATTPQRKIIVVPRNVNETVELRVPKIEPDIDTLEITDDSTQLDFEVCKKNVSDVNVSSNTQLDDNTSTDIAFSPDAASLHVNTSFVTDDSYTQFDNFQGGENTPSKKSDFRDDLRPKEKLKAMEETDFETNPNRGMSSKGLDVNPIAPPPPKKRMLLKSFEEDKTTLGTQDIVLNNCTQNAFPVSNSAVKQPKTYSRKKI